MSTSIENIVIEIKDLLECCLLGNQNDEIILPEGLQLNGVPDQHNNTVKSKVRCWLHGKGYLEFKITKEAGLYIRLNQSHFDFQDDKLVITDRKAFSFYHRRRKPGRKNAQMTLICHLLKMGLSDMIEQHMNTVPILKKLEKQTINTYEAKQSTIPTLKEFLPTYKCIMYSENAATAHTRVALIINQFSDYFNYPVNQIKGAELLEFRQKFTRDLTAAEIQEGASRFIVEESTLKGYFGGIRGLLKRASKYSEHPFELCKTIYDKQLEFNINNEVERNLTDEQIILLIKSLAERDMQKFKAVDTSKFTDYLTPFILLCLSTGLRPKYALKLKWSEIDFELNKILVKGDGGKIKNNKYCDITEEAWLVLKEWKRHVIHTKSKNNWVFPSPKNPSLHLKSYKTTFKTFRENYGLEFMEMYDTRHTFASIFTSAYQNIHTTKDALHHRQLRSTERYSRHLKSDRKEATQAFEKKMPSFAAVL